jgi:hypothetical protein
VTNAAADEEDCDPALNRMGKKLKARIYNA